MIDKLTHLFIFSIGWFLELNHKLLLLIKDTCHPPNNNDAEFYSHGKVFSLSDLFFLEITAKGVNKINNSAPTPGLKIERQISIT